MSSMNIITGIDALLVTNPTNVRYLTGFVGAAPDEREAYYLLTKSHAYLFTNTLYRQEALKLTSFKRLNLLGTKGLSIVEISREEPFAKKLAEVLKKGVRLGFEETDLTVAEYHKIMHVHKNVILVPTKGRIEELRMMKRDDEIENIRIAAKLTDQCFDFILGKIEIGVTETDIAWKIESFIKMRGASLAFSPIVAFGKNSSMPHYQSSDVSLQSSDLILLDFGARVNDYCSDMTRVIFIDKPNDELKRAYSTVLEAQSVALKNLQNNPDKWAREVIKKAGFPPYPHSLGHGVGLAIHEQPRPSYKKNVKLRPGMVITVEPGIYMQGSYGIRIEDLVLLKEDGIELLSKSKREMIIL